MSRVFRRPGSGSIDAGPPPGAVRRGARASAVVLVVTQAATFLQTLILARLLTPEEVGLFAAGTVLSALLVTFSEGGLRNALVQRESDVAVAAETVFWAGLGGGVLWAAVTAAAAPLIGALFGSPIAGVITAVTAGTLVLQALTYVPDALMQRRLDVRQRLVVPPAITLGFGVTSVAFAFAGFGVWALVIGSYVQHLAWIVASWSLAGWRPGGARFSYPVWRQLSRFAFPLVLSGLVDRGRELAETALVGRRLGETALGHYRYGRRLATLPGTAIIEVFSYVLFPTFSRIARDAAAFRATFLRSLELIWFVSCPVAGLIVVIGEPTVVLLLGEQWRGAGVAVVAMAGFGPGVAMSAVGTEAIKGCGRSGLLNWLTLAGVLVGVGALVALLPYGLVGVGLALSIDSLVCGFLALLLARPGVAVRLRDVLGCLLPTLSATVAAMIVTGALDAHLLLAGSRPAAVAAATLLGELVIFGGTFFTVMCVTAPARTRAIVRALADFVGPSKR